MADLGQAGTINVVPPAALEAQLQQKDQAAAAAQQQADMPTVPELAGFIKGKFEIFRNHRNTVAGWSDRMLESLRIFNGQYSPSKLQEIRKWGGSEIYARVIAQKCRAASSLLRDVYLSTDRPWSIDPPVDPDIPPEIFQKIDALMQQEQQMIQQTTGQPAPQTDVQKRKDALVDSAEDAAKKKAADQACTSEEKIEEILRDGGFYHALAEFLVDLPIFPFACIKGPVVKVVPVVEWPPNGGQPTVKQKPMLTWARVSPFDLWFTPGVGDIANADVIEKVRYTRAELNDLLDLPGYNQTEVRAVLDEYGRGGLYDNWDTTDAERAVLESRENPAWNRSGMITGMEFHGNVQGRVLQDYGLAVPDELRDYHIEAWVIGSHVIKANLSPSPRQRHPYFTTSFEKVPGTPVGNGLTDLLTDIQEAGNATLRSMINNLSIASGPQVMIDLARLAPGENPEDLFPWKRWYLKNDPFGTQSSKPAIEFYQPQSNANELMMIYKSLMEISDDVSAIPKYIGGQAGGGAARTSSGLAMLMGNASKILQTVSANIDRDIFEVALTQLEDLILLTDTTGLLTGMEKFSVRGVQVAIQRETQRQRQLEFLQHTANPLDQKIMGISGRGKVLRAISSDLGIMGEDIVPDDSILDKMQQADLASQQAGPIDQMVQKGVQAGVEAGVKRISTELTAGILAARAAMPEGAPIHIGTPAGAPGGAPPVTNGAAPPGGSPPAVNGSPALAAKAQGMQPTPMSAQQGPRTNLQQSRPAPIEGGPH